LKKKIHIRALKAKATIACRGTIFQTIQVFITRKMPQRASLFRIMDNPWRTLSCQSITTSLYVDTAGVVNKTSQHGDDSGPTSQIWSIMGPFQSAGGSVAVISQTLVIVIMTAEPTVCNCSALSVSATTTADRDFISISLQNVF